MALKKREKILAIASACLLGALAVVFLVFGSGGSSLSLGELRKQRDKKREELAKETAKSNGAGANAAKIKTWEKRALPTSLDVARSAYQSWLHKLVEQHKFREPDVFSGEGQSRRGAMTVFPFRVQGRAGAEQITRFLYDFYASPHFHQIRRFVISPLDGGKEFDVKISIEAASLPTADRVDSLSKAETSRLKRKDADAYVKSIIRRRMEDDRFLETGGLFAAYAPPPLPPRDPPPKLVDPPKPKFDHLKQTILTGLVAVDGKPEAWLLVKTTGQRLTLAEGASFEVGEKRGKVLSIGQREAVFEIDGQALTVRQGESLGSSRP